MTGVANATAALTTVGTGGHRAAEAPDDPAPVIAVADNLTRLLRAFGQARSRVVAKAEHDVEWSAHIVLKHLQAMGAMRAGNLADVLHSDPSTVSRQVAAMVKDGLIERRADPHDGRASLLVLTEHGEDVISRHDELRMRWFASMLEDWSAEDLRSFATQLARFTDHFDRLDHEWLAAEIARATREARTASVPSSEGDHS